MVKMGSVSKITIFWAKIDSEKWTLKIYLEIFQEGNQFVLLLKFSYKSTSYSEESQNFQTTFHPQSYAKSFLP